MESIAINGEEYVKKSTVNSMAEQLDGKKYVIVRTYSAGVFAGYLNSRNGQEVELFKARRLWYWEGAASLSQLAVDGVSKPQKCKFPEEIPVLLLLQAIEIIGVSEKAKKSIDSVSVWKA